MADTWVVPNADVVDGLWTNQAGSQTNLYESVNDPYSVVMDTDYIQSDTTPDADLVRLGLESMTAPASGEAVLHIRGRWGSTAPTTTTIYFAWEAYPGATAYYLLLATRSGGPYATYTEMDPLIRTMSLDLSTGTYYSCVQAYQGAVLVNTTAEQTVTVP